jgi:hypothetical protein
MGMPVASHKPPTPGAGPITGRESAKQGRLPIQGEASTGSPNGNSARGRHKPPELRRARRRIAGRDLGAGRQPNPLLHRRQAIADLSIDDRAGKRGVAGRPEVAVIATPTCWTVRP